MKVIRKLDSILFLCLLTACFGIGCGKQVVNPQQEVSVVTGEFTATFVGDIMMHEWQITRSYDAETMTFDVSESFQFMQDKLSFADLTVGNLETTLAGKKEGFQNRVLGYSGYPYFNSPEILAKNLKDAGFDLLTTANNHCMDSGTKGIESTLQELEQAGLYHTGTGENQTRRLEINGVTLGILSATYDVNIPIPSGCGELVNTLNGYEEAQILQLLEDVKNMKQDEEIDFVCVLIHWGEEYQDEVSENQRLLAQRLVASGADLIVGSHPHVVQPIEKIVVTKEDGTTCEGMVCYSLGDFLSGAAYANDGIDKDLGLVVTFRLSTYIEQGQKRTSLEIEDCVTTYLYWTRDLIAPIPVSDVWNGEIHIDPLSQKDKERLGYAVKKDWNCAD